MSWHEQDEFWITMGPSMFTADRWEAAPVEVNRIVGLVELSLDAKILDLGCGPGRHSLSFARQGFHVTGVDRTSYYLKQGRKTAAEEGLDIDFILEDMRSFQRNDLFDLALSLYTTFGYFEDYDDNIRVLRNIYQALKPSGTVLIEMMGKEILARIFQERNWHEQDGVLYLEERRIIDNWRRIENRWIKIEGSKRTEFDLGHWIFSAAEFTSLLEEVGFQEIEIYGDLEGRPYDHTASRLVATGCKPE